VQPLGATAVPGPDAGLKRGGFAAGIWLVRLLLGLVLLSLAAAWCGSALMRALAPAQSALFHALNPDFQLVGYGELPGGQWSADITLRRILVLGQQLRHPDPRARANASMPIARTWIAPVLLLATAGAWPLGWRRTLGLLLVALPLAALLLWVDAPLVLSGVIWQLLLDMMAADEWRVLVVIKEFWEGGGRIALALALGTGLGLVFMSRGDVPEHATPGLQSAR
jgi:hypothetical protein